jgi:hypothetical protein
MKTRIFIAFVVLSASIFTTGCTESYLSQGSHVYHHSQPSTGEALQALGELAYQAGGKRVTRQKYNDNMDGLGALGILMDITK